MDPTTEGWLSPGRPDRAPGPLLGEPTGAPRGPLRVFTSCQDIISIRISNLIALKDRAQIKLQAACKPNPTFIARTMRARAGFLLFLRGSLTQYTYKFEWETTWSGWHLAPAGATSCDFGDTASMNGNGVLNHGAQCSAAVSALASAAGESSSRVRQTSWGSVLEDPNPRFSTQPADEREFESLSLAAIPGAE